MIVRPPEYIEDGRERELEIAAAEARLAQMDSWRVRTATSRSRRLPPLPELPAPAEGAVRHLLQAARPALEDLPVLRGRDRPARARRRGGPSTQQQFGPRPP